MQAQSQKKHMDILHILFFFPFGMDFVAKIMHEALLFFHFIEQFFLQRPRLHRAGGASSFFAFERFYGQVLRDLI